jgi:DNA invertase Pin-like site-specific DNA recombinase
MATGHNKRGFQMKKAVAYIRVSTVEQAVEGVSLDAQAERIRAYCQLAGLELMDIIREEGVSGTVPLAQRPAGQRLIAALDQHKAAHVIALKLDRLFRDAADALIQTRQWDGKGIALHLVDVGGQTINTASAMGRWFLTMLAGFAELERNQIAERTSTALRHKKSKREVYSPTPFGFDLTDDKKLSENAAEMAIVQAIASQHKNGVSMNQIAAGLNAQGVRGKKGGAFYASTVRHILGNTIYAPCIQS